MIYDDYFIETLTGCTFDADGECIDVSPFVSNVNNGSYNKEEICAWSAAFALHQVQQFFAEHYLDNGIFNNKANYFSSIVPLDIYIGYNRPASAYYNFDLVAGIQPHIYLTTGLRLTSGYEDNKPFTNLEIVAHEYNHHLQFYNYSIRNTINKNQETNALQEGLSDIYSVYAVNKIYGNDDENIDWEFGDEVVNPSYTNNLLPRVLSNPLSSGLQQAVVYNSNWSEVNRSNIPDFIVNDSQVPYYKAGVISYWFYLLAEGSNSKVNGVDISSIGLGIDKAEKILFGSLQLLSDKIISIPIISGYDTGNINFIEFRNTVLEYVATRYNLPNSYGVCSGEFSQVYRAFQAVGLINEDLSYINLPCNVISYNTALFENCPPVNNLKCKDVGDDEDDIQQVNLTFPNNMLDDGIYYIQVYFDPFGTGDFIFEYHFSIDEPLTSTYLDDYMMPPFTVQSYSTPVKIIVYEVSDVNLLTTVDSIELPSSTYIFSCADACNLILDDAYPLPEYPNQGAINISVNSSNISTCNGSNICIEYTANGPAQIFASINSNNFSHLITDITSTSQSGSFCWLPDIGDIGTHNFEITVTDSHYDQPLTSVYPVTITILDVDFTTDIWQTSDPAAYKTNESSAGANDGSIKINLGSTHTLQYHFNGPGSYNLVTQNNTATGLADGAYTIDVYINGTNCLYNTYTATVGTNTSSQNSDCFFNPNNLLLRAVPAIFNDQTTIEIELQEQPLQLSLDAFNIQGNPVQNLVSGQILPVGTHQVSFNGSSEPNGLYVFRLMVNIPHCRSGEEESISIKGFKY